MYSVFQGRLTLHQWVCSLKTETTPLMLFTLLLFQSRNTDRQTCTRAHMQHLYVLRTWQRIMTWVTFGLLSLVSVLSSPVRTDRTKSPGWLWLSRTRKLPFLPFSVKSFSASRPDKCPWNHLQSKWGRIQNGQNSHIEWCKDFQSKLTETHTTTFNDILQVTRKNKVRMIIDTILVIKML